MTPKQQEQFTRMYLTLQRIAKDYMTPEQLRKKTDKIYGLNYTEALEMSYENIQEEARQAIQGIKKPKPQKSL